MSKIYLFVEISVKSGQLAGFVEKLQAHADGIRREDGCENLALFYDSDSSESVCVWEIWRDRASWDAHMVNDSSKTWQSVAKDFVNGEKITVMSAI